MFSVKTGDELRRHWHVAFGEHLAKRGGVALTVEEVAGLLQVSPRHIYKLVEEHKIPHVRIGAAVRFDPKDISEWVSKMAAANAPDDSATVQLPRTRRSAPASRNVSPTSRAAVSPQGHEAASAAKAQEKPGDRMEDGTIYAGVSPETNTAMYTTPADAPQACTHDEAERYAKQMDAHGHKDWRLPTLRELSVLFNNRAAIGGFEGQNGWYWSSTLRWESFGDEAWGAGFHGAGAENYCRRDIRARVRSVRV